MSKPLSIRAIRENILLSLIATRARSVGELNACAGFTRHDSRVRALLVGLGDAGQVEFTPHGQWRITSCGLERLAQRVGQ